MNTEENTSDRPLGLWVILLLTIFAWAPATYPGYWQSVDGFAPIFNTLYPGPVANIATIPDLWRGTGSAAFILTHPLTQLGVSPTVAVRILFILTVLLGSLSTYIWLRPRFGDRAAGLAGLLYGLMPPLLTTIYVRGSLADALVLALLPLALAGFSFYRISRNPAAIGAGVLALLWIWRTQAGLAVFASIMLLLYVLLVERDRLAALAVSVATAAGLLSLIPIWQVRGPAPVPFAEQGLDLYQLLLGAGDTTQPFLLGFIPIAFALAALWLFWMRHRGGTDDEAGYDPLPGLQGRLLLFGVLAWPVAALLSLDISMPLWTLSGADRLLTYPWQILLPTLPFLAAAAGALPLLSASLAQRTFWPALLALVILGSVPYLTPNFTQYQPPALPAAVYGESAKLVLLEATIDEEAGMAELSVAWQPLQSIRFDYNLFFQALRAADTEDGYQVIAQLDQQPLAEYPATTWQPGEILTATYRLDLPVDPNETTLRYYFGYYDWRDGTRIPLTSGADDKVILYGN
jgi:hypothetical protein